MAALSSSFLSTAFPANQHFFPNFNINTKRVSFNIQAAKLPAGVELPKEVPKLSRPLLGFTKTAEIWNSRACMIGLIGTFIVELIFNKGILEMIGVEIGKGLDIPL
ncbi:Light-harvesting complex-like protein ohp1, chloroplastic [Datura stramonium]|uniref:Light-harvesting complex-like protein ohp1, chloroplastic n=1 Tax=Datura stramonium TaxID=4076 RepID=A0ABS8S6R4_DATST|nr:Light-harvesting complex-like protein ohp1, chloroplastic [Datura stramonium]